MFGLNNGDNFVMEDLWYIPMGDHLPVYNRPYSVTADFAAIDMVADRLMESNSGIITPGIIGDLSTRLINNSAVGSISFVDQTWVSTRRFIFVLKVRTSDSFGLEGYTYIQGYTDHDGITQTGHADERMTHFINNVIETSIMTINTPLGVTRSERLSKVYNVLSSQNQDYFTQRPRDVIENIDLQNMSETMSSHDIFVEGVHTGNLVTGFNGNVISSAVSNSVGTEYLSKILNGGINKHKAKEILTDSYEVFSESSMGEQIVEPSINDNRFIKYLSSVGGFKSTMDYFSFGQLTAIDPTIYDRFTLFNITKNYVDPSIANTPTTGEYWHGQDPVTLRAYSLIESSVSLATRHGFNKLFFTATNMADITGRMDVMITNFNSYINLGDRDIAQLLELFKNKFIMDVFISETQGGMIPVFMEVYVDLLGTSKIKLSYSGLPETWYTIPTSANSLFSPVLTTDHSGLDYATKQFTGLIDAIGNKETKFRNYY